MGDLSERVRKTAADAGWDANKLLDEVLAFIEDGHYGGGEPLFRWLRSRASGQEVNGMEGVTQSEVTIESTGTVVTFESDKEDGNVTISAEAVSLQETLTADEAVTVGQALVDAATAARNEA